ncbi:GNAT family N-acetyltransferase [Nocardioides cynanchi]|uniref:GNAT family N-acetyltransferase n=1 Tax=Nocardioides cynanchi TaxID=2558918 RepID=UPI001247D0C5|nr:GNAT family protein [Nocardioides cynanchi]
MEWPFFDLRVSCGEVLLRGVTDADLDPLLAVLPGDLEHDPRSERLAELDDEADHRRLFTANLWKHRGSWSPASWCLELAVEVDGAVVGVQALEGDDFPLLRTVDSYSWLTAGVRGRGLATSLRTGVLALAFDHLGAVAAVSSATMDNAPSLAVSRRLGYADNGVSLIRTAAGAEQLQHLRLTRERWLADAHDVEVTGIEACLPWFGLSG